MVKKADPKPDLSNVVTDASIAADKAIEKEADVRQQLDDLKEIHETPDMPRMIPNRWGENKRLTFATPGTLQRDPFYIPEFVDTTESGVRRRVSVHRYINGQLHILTPDGKAKFRWTAVGKIGIQKRYGFRFTPYEGMFEGTGLFEQRDNRVWNGDVVLMYIGLDAWEKQREHVRELNAYLEGSYGSQFFQNAQNTGTPSFVDDEKRGVREFMT